MNRYVRKNIKGFIFTVIVCFLYSLIPIGMAFIIEMISDIALNNHTNIIDDCLLYIVIFIITAMIISKVYSYQKAKFREDVNQDLAADLYRKILDLEYMQFTKQNVGDYLSYFTNDLKMIDERYFQTVISCVNALIQLIVVVVYISNINIMIALIMFFISICTMAVPKVMGKQLSIKANGYANYMGVFNSKFKEYFQGIRVIHDFHRKQVFYKEGEDVLKELNAKHRQLNYKTSMMGNMSNVFGVSCQFFLLLVISIFVVQGKVASVYIMSIVSISSNFISSVYEIANGYGNIQSIKEINNKIMQFLDYPCSEEIIETEDITTIDFQDVSFSYGDVLVLKNFNHKFYKGKKYAVVGASGSGKSTLFKLLLGYYSPTKGEILINDKQNRNHDMTIIHQESYVFTDTVKQNICLYQDIEENKLKKSLKFANLETICLDDVVEENGKNWSGGQIQRVGIARAYANLKGVLLCDEITSHLDNVSARKIEENILHLKDQMVIYITHKILPETISMFDEIIVLNKGKIVEVGTYQELIDKQQEFYNIYYNRKEGII